MASRRRVPWLPFTVVTLLCAAACGKIYEEVETPSTFELAEGTRIAVLLKPANAVETLEPGDPFAAILAETLYYTWEAIDPEGRVYERKETVAPQGAAAFGILTEEPDPRTGEPKLFLELTSVTFHGGKSFPVVTTRVEPPSQDPPEALVFQLAQPADIALVIEQRGESS